LLLAKRKFIKSQNFFDNFLKGRQIQQKNRDKHFQKEEKAGRRKRPALHSHRKIPAPRETE